MECGEKDGEGRALTMWKMILIMGAGESNRFTLCVKTYGEIRIESASLYTVPTIQPPEAETSSNSALTGVW